MSEDWMDEANKRLGDTSVFALWEEQVRKAKERRHEVWLEDEGAGCSDADVFVLRFRPEIEACGWVVIEKLSDDPRECRRELSAQLEKFGDTVWTEIQNRKGWANGGS